MRELQTELLKLQAIDDTFAYGELVFGYEAAAHHREMVDFIDEGIRLHQHTIVLEPRGGAKSTWGNLIKMSHVIAKNPDIRIGLFSKTAQHAFDMSRGIRSTLERNQNFRELFGHMVSDVKWTDAQWLCAGSRWHGSQYATLFAQGVGGQVVSKRFDLILMDDILDEENTSSQEQMDSVRNWFWKTVLPCLAPGGVVVCLGTRWADGDFYEELLTPKADGGKGWRSLVRGALVKGDDGKLHSYWPEIWPLELLMEYKEGMGSALFACAYLNDVSGLMAGNVFLGEDFQWFGTLPQGPKYTIRMGVDLASSSKESADYTARVTTAEDDEGNFYVLSFHRERIETGHAQFVVDGWMAYPEMAAIMVESVSFQSTLIKELMRDYPRLPVVPQKADSDKKTRARAVAAKMEAHKVWFHNSIRESDLHRELLMFDRGHDDLVDSLGYSMALGGGEFSWTFVRVA